MSTSDAGTADIHTPGSDSSGESENLGLGLYAPSRGDKAYTTNGAVTSSSRNLHGARPGFAPSASAPDLRSSEASQLRLSENSPHKLRSGRKYTSASARQFPTADQLIRETVEEAYQSWNAPSDTRNKRADHSASSGPSPRSSTVLKHSAKVDKRDIAEITSLQSSTTILVPVGSSASNTPPTEVLPVPQQTISCSQQDLILEWDNMRAEQTKAQSLRQSAHASTHGSARGSPVPSLAGSRCASQKPPQRVHTPTRPPSVAGSAVPQVSQDSPHLYGQVRLHSRLVPTPLPSPAGSRKQVWNPAQLAHNQRRKTQSLPSKRTTTLAPTLLTPASFSVPAEQGRPAQTTPVVPTVQNQTLLPPSVGISIIPQAENDHPTKCRCRACLSLHKVHSWRDSLSEHLDAVEENQDSVTGYDSYSVSPELLNLRSQVATLTDELHRTKLDLAYRPRSGVRAINPDKYKLGHDWGAYIARFLEASRLNGWSEQEAALRLRFCLDSEVHELIDPAVYIPPNCTIQELVQIISPLLSPVNEAETAAAQFGDRRIKPDESYQHYLIALQKLVLKAYPEDSAASRVRRLKEQFIAGCGDVELARFILDRDITQAEQLVYLAERHKSNRVALQKVAPALAGPPRVADPWLPEMFAKPKEGFKKQASQYSTAKSAPKDDIRTIIREELDPSQTRMSNRIGNLEKRVAKHTSKTGGSKSTGSSSRQGGQNWHRRGYRSNVQSESTPSATAHNQPNGSSQRRSNTQGTARTGSSRRPMKK